MAVGIDDYALRKGHVYGTVVINMQTRRPVDFYPTGEPRPWQPGYPNTPRSKPPAMLDEPNLDQERCYVVMRETGLTEKVANAFGEDGDDQEFYLLAEQKIAAAADKSELRDRATFNTKQMLRGMFQALGYEVTFDGTAL